MPKISLVTSLYKAAQYVPELYERSRAALLDCTDVYEIIFVDDGSPDGARDTVLALIAKDSNVRLVELSRNFGQHRALFTGLQHATGDLVFMIDADLEEDPALVRQFYERMNAEPEVDVVYGVMTSRKGGFAERTFGSWFYSAINLVSSVEIPRNVMNARLMRRRYVDALLQYRDVEPFLGGLMAHVGFRQLALPCEKGSRDGSSYTFRRKLRLALDALFGFSTVPLTAVAAMGWGIALAALLVGIFRIFDGRTESDAALLLWSMWFLGGAMLGSVGIVGMYVGRALAQARQRPIAVVKELYGFPSE